MAELSRRYATALFELATESGDFEGFLSQAHLVNDSLDIDECRKVIEHPLIATKDKRQLIDAAFSGNVNEHLIGFLYLAIDKNRERFIRPAFKDFFQMSDAFLGKTNANVVSATPLKPEQVEQLEALLSKKLNKRVSVITRVDPSLLGGLSIHVDGYLIDRTLKTQLRNMRNSMKRGTSDDPET